MKNHSFVLTILAVLYCVSLVQANIVSNKLIQLAGFLTIDAGFLFFPITYIINDIVTEVYGFKIARKIIWIGLFANAFAALNLYIVINFPPSPHFEHQGAFEQVFSSSMRIFAASMISYLFGEFLNSMLLSKLKVITAGRYMSSRFITSTIVGAAVENTLFYLIAFSFSLPWEVIFEMMLIQYLLKIFYEVILLPITLTVTTKLKKFDKTDIFDRKESFNPLQF
ncbi:MAG: queuosine precursor transporter [Rickettsiales bacterium]